jgi:hypothetical protein
MVIKKQQGLTIGSGSVESTVKQIGRRVKISGAQWHKSNVAQVLNHLGFQESLRLSQ